MPTDLIEAYLEDLRMHEMSPQTIDDRGKILRRINRELPMGLDVATAEELQSWLYRDGWSAQTKATYLGAIRGFFLRALDPKDPWLDYDPTELLARPKVPSKVPRPALDGEVAEIMATCAEPYLFWSLLAAYEGLRCCEISALDRDDITERRTYLKGKGAKERAVPTDPAVWRIAQRMPPGPVARGCGTRRYTRATADEVSNRASYHFERRIFQRPGMTLHRLRHWFATQALAKYKNVRVVQELLGHAALSSTMIYTKVEFEQMEEAVRGLPRFAVGGGAGGASGEAAR